jgi:hypothetical protein
MQIMEQLKVLKPLAEKDNLTCQASSLKALMGDPSLVQVV